MTYYENTMEVLLKEKNHLQNILKSFRKIKFLQNDPLTNLRKIKQEARK